eukprot:COSAG01_NODE_20293_length_961_cov_1.098608_3_plen_66_part_01
MQPGALDLARSPNSPKPTKISAAVSHKSFAAASHERSCPMHYLVQLPATSRSVAILQEFQMGLSVT